MQPTAHTRCPIDPPACQIKASRVISSQAITRGTCMTRKAALVGLASLTLLACQPDDGDDVPAGVFDPGLVDRQQAKCAADGGRWGAGGGNGNFVCYMPTKDANQTCTSGLDCEGLCLARSRTCAPVTPFFGCHEVLNSRGAAQTLCIE